MSMKWGNPIYKICPKCKKEIKFVLVIMYDNHVEECKGKQKK